MYAQSFGPDMTSATFNIYSRAYRETAGLVIMSVAMVWNRNSIHRQRKYLQIYTEN